MAGMTCTGRSGLGGQQPAMEADRQGAVAQQRVVEPLEAEVRAETTLLVGAQPEQQGPTEQVRERVRGPVGVPLDLGRGVRALEAGVLDEELGRLLRGQLAAMHPDVE